MKSGEVPPRVNKIGSLPCAKRIIPHGPTTTVTGGEATIETRRADLYSTHPFLYTIYSYRTPGALPSTITLFRRGLMGRLTYGFLIRSGTHLERMLNRSYPPL